MVSRRTVLGALGATGLAVTGVAAALNGNAPGGEALRHVLGVAGPVPAGKRPVVRVDRVYSRYRRREVDLLTILPPGLPTGTVPMSVLLHGLHGSARYAAVGGMSEALVAAVGRRSVPPYGFVAVDGGDNYWHENSPGDDPMAMLLEEVPRWLAERSYGPVVACTGVSMGGFGALVYARRRAERRDPLKAVAAVSPGLLLNWPDMAKRRVFANQEEWASVDPLKHVDDLGPTPVGVWVGDHDRFIQGTREFIAAAKPAVASVTPGGHDDVFYRKIVPDVIRFLGKRVTAKPTG
ncbi:alpha/beta hydrolase-fold protein [Actinosynnema sp. NPDC023587]|uniref:alpha/beta hydrolase n=1 Tax=Actinosynnema sp. NPDC023587 TaxID=3154695 RepID=UPI00340E703D